MSDSPKMVLVTGDVVVDHHIYVGERLVPNAPEKAGTRERSSDGGAGLLWRILEEISSQRSGADGAPRPFEARLGLNRDIFLKLPPSQNGYALWKPFPYDKDQRVWRMAQSLGYGNSCGEPFSHAEYALEEPLHPSVVAVDDGGLGFRHSTQKGAWPGAFFQKQARAPEWIVLKMSSPVGQGDLWRHLSTHFADRLVVVLSISDIRREEVRVSRGVSWERTATDLAEELCFNAAIRALLHCRHLIIHFGSEGALHVEQIGEERVFRLTYDPENMEREWSAAVEGQGLGYMACLTSGIVDRLLDPDHPDPICEGIRAGLSAMRTMHLKGHGPFGCSDPGFPLTDVARDVIRPRHVYSSIELPNPEKTDDEIRKNWTIMTAFLEGIQKNPRPLFGIGRRVAILGPKALTHIPCARFGKLYTADRNEIESLRNIRTLILDYENYDKGKKPLSLAVFGPPGAGKSFGIVQIAQGIMGKDVPILEFNLSQFDGPASLIGAFHQVRDKALQGSTPLVFWDEFDSKEYAWLQYLLAPMQDGKFLEGQVSHPIGKSVFVFAGGTSYDMENFGPRETDEKKWHEFKLKKGPDFKSRLSGYLNVLGPNRRQNYDLSHNQWSDDPEDVCFPVRRALLIRSMLGLKENQRLESDRGILSALIETKRFTHGARSLEKIVTQLKKPGQPGIRRSDLPSHETLSIHADAEDFLSIVNRDLKFKTRAEELAPFVHGFYRSLGKKEGWIRKDMDRDYESLAEDYKEDNRAAAARIPQVLDLVGLYVVPRSYPVTNSLQQIRQIIAANLELLAEAEHNDWADHKIRNGWVYGENRDDSRKVQDCLLPYAELAEKDRNKDRNSVRNYPAIIQKAKYKIVLKLDGQRSPRT